MRTVIHIGYPKTATTYLQNIVFPSLNTDHVNYISYSAIRKSPLKQICRMFSESVDVNYSRSSLPLDVGRVNLLSYEGFIGNWRTGALNQIEIFRSLKKIFDKPTILVIIRDQESMLLSLFKQYIQEGGTSRLKNFLRSTNDNTFTNWDFLNYLKTYERLVEIFGDESVVFLPYELMLKDKPAFLKNIEHVLGVDVPNKMPTGRSNKSLHYHLISTLRIANFVLRGSLHTNYLVPARIISSSDVRFFLQNKMNERFHRWFPKAEQRLAQKYKAELDNIRAYYSESNAGIASIIKAISNINLLELNYCVDTKR